MRYCRKCVQPDTRPNIFFTGDGMCGACYFAKEQDSLDWTGREAELLEIAEWAKVNAGDGYECIVGVSGGRDSHFQAFYARDRLGLKVLLVNCAPDHITDVGRHNLENLVQHGFDLISYRPNPKVMCAATRKSFFKYGNVAKPSEYPLHAAPYQIALRFEIPLIIQGENPGIALGTVEPGLPPDGNALNIKAHNTVAGGNASDWVEDGIGLRDLLPYQFPHLSKLEKSGIVAIFLGYYAKEWSYTGNTLFARKRGFRGRPDHDPSQTGFLSPYAQIDSDIHVINQMLKYYKFGFGFVTDEVCYHIREGILSREQAIPLVERYDGKCGHPYVYKFCEYIGISQQRFYEIVDRFVNKDLFRRYHSKGRWIPRFKVSYGLIQGK